MSTSWLKFCLLYLDFARFLVELWDTFTIRVSLFYASHCGMPRTPVSALLHAIRTSLTSGGSKHRLALSTNGVQWVMSDTELRTNMDWCQTAFESAYGGVVDTRVEASWLRYFEWLDCLSTHLPLRKFSRLNQCLWKQYVFISCNFVWDEYLGIHVPLSNKKKCYALRLRLHCYHKYCGYQRWSRRFQEMLGHQWASRIVEQLSFFERSRRWLTSGCRL